MDYFEKVRKLLKIQDLSKRRIEQLEKERIFDEYLNESYKKCPSLVFQYLMKSRELNRKYSRETYIVSVFDYPEKVEKNLDIVDKTYQKYFNDCPVKICEQLPNLLEDLNSL